MAEIIIDNLVFCTDCTIAAANGDLSGIEDDQQYADTTTGLERLGKISAVYHAGQEPDEFSTRPCDCCGSRLAGSRDYFIILK